MRKVAMMLMAAGLLICAAPYGRTDPSAPKNDKLENARKAEEKGDVARVKKNFAVAGAYYQAAIHYSRQDARLYNKLGIVQLQQGQRGAARKNFSQALKLDPQLVAAVNNLGAASLLDKRYKSAVDYFKQALAMDETSAATHLNLAESWMGLGEVDHAMTEYSRALELDADILTSTDAGVIAQVSTPQQRARIMYMIAKSYAKRGNLDGAVEYLQRAKDLHNPDLAKVYTDPDFTALWQDPRLAKIVKR
ncbi:MAG: tetratricopeptide repeat protein [Terracidiphilus sp.]|jgi:tetratricopeptide (TPR) repeat protein